MPTLDELLMRIEALESTSNAHHECLSDGDDINRSLLTRIEALESSLRVHEHSVVVHDCAKRDKTEDAFNERISALEARKQVPIRNLGVRCVLVHPNAKLPTRGSEDAAGLDLYAAHDGLVVDGLPCAIDTGVVFEIPQGYFGAVCQRSGILRKHGIVCGYGVIDSDYRSSIGITLYHSSPRDEHFLARSPYHVMAGDRVAQLVILPCPRVELLEVDSVDELSSTARGCGGFGSSGK